MQTIKIDAIAKNLQSKSIKFEKSRRYFQYGVVSYTFNIAVIT